MDRGIERLKEKTDRPLVVMIFLGMVLLVLPSILSAAEPNRFSPECDKTRIDAIRAYWSANSDAVLGARMAEILSSSTSNELSILMIGEVLSGRVSAKQVGEGALAGLNAIGFSPSCNESDREAAEQFRALLPKIVSGLEAKAAEMRKGP